MKTFTTEIYCKKLGKLHCDEHGKWNVQIFQSPRGDSDAIIVQEECKSLYEVTDGEMKKSPMLQNCYAHLIYIQLIYNYSKMNHWMPPPCRQKWRYNFIPFKVDDWANTFSVIPNKKVLYKMRWRNVWFGL
jgi:hypothetical protein